MKRLTVVVAVCVAAAAPAAQHYQSDVPAEEFRARWNGVFDRSS